MLAIGAVIVPTPAEVCSGTNIPAGCASLTELGPRAQWLAIAGLELAVALIGAIIGLSAIIALQVLLRRAS